MRIPVRLVALARLARRRGPGRWAASYAAGAWVVLQVVDVLVDAFDASARVLQTAALLLVVGFPGAVLLAWQVRTVQRGRTFRLGLWMAGALLTPLLLLVPLLTGRADADGAGPEWEGIAVGAGSPDARRVDARSIAVLPFVQLSGDAEDGYLADGIHEEILTTLASVGDLRVTSRSSVLHYRGTDASLDSIGRALGVAMVLEGSVRREAERVRVSVRLLEAASGESLWAESYDGRGTSVLEMQSDVAREVAAALQVRLTTSERARLARRPTSDPEAYDEYLRARELMGRPGYAAADLEAAEALYDRAIARDSGFALALAHLGNLHVLVYRFAIDRTDERRERARWATERALELDPLLPDARLARGYYLYQVEGDHAAALTEFERALSEAPHAADVLAAVGFVNRRQGRWDVAVRHLELAADRDPMNPDLQVALGTTFTALRRYEDADRAYRRTLGIAPGSTVAALQRGLLFVQARGELDTLRASLAALPAGAEPRDRVTRAGYRLAWLEGRFEDALRVVREGGVAIFARPGSLEPASLLEARALEAVGNAAGAWVAYGQAKILLEERLRLRPDEAAAHAAMALVDVGLGRHAEALHHADEAVRLDPEDRNAMYGPGYAAVRAEVLARAGRLEESLAEARRLLSVPAGLTVHELRLDPRWEALRQHPGFAGLVTP